MSSGASNSTYFRASDIGIAVFVRLTPGSSRDALEGSDIAADGRTYLKARVRAVPEDGKANRALEKLLAKKLGVAARDVSVTAGATSRLKTLQVSGDPTELAEKLRALVDESG